jgi:hypothetical protein
LGDPVDALLSQWARQCRRRGGLVVLPHFPQPRAEHAAVLVQGLADGVEMTSWGHRDLGVDPYSLSDWYRYLNCGYHVPCVAGTDKMSADTAVGTVRVYTRLPQDRPWDYELWMRCMRGGETFVSYGPLLEFSVEGKPAGGRVKLRRGGGTLQVRWKAESVVRQMSSVELVVNGEVVRTQALHPWRAEGSWEIPVAESSWMALLLRGKTLKGGGPELIAAHSSAVMVDVEGRPLFSRLDAVSILEQIEGSLAYIDHIGTRAQARAYKAMRLELQSAHRRLHERLHSLGKDHPHHGPHRHHGRGASKS